jgi:hypothetical protein
VTRARTPWLALVAALLCTATALSEPALADGATSPSAGQAGSGQGAADGEGGDVQALFAAANALYFQGDWTAAGKAYASIVERFEVEDPILYHNLGNACFRSGAYGLAILYYKRAQKLDPTGPLADALDQNLDAARRTLQARYRQSSDATLVYADPTGIVFQITHLVGEPILVVLFTVLWLGFFGMLILRRLRTRARWPGRVAVPLGLLVVLAGALVWGRIATDADQRVGVVVSPDAMLRDGKHVVAQGKALPEGLEVRILDGDSAWTQVELAGGRRGWVVSKNVKQI